MSKYSITLFGHRTSISLESIFWSMLNAYAQYHDMSLSKVVEGVDQNRENNLSSSLRVFLLEHFAQNPQHFHQWSMKYCQDQKNKNLKGGF